MSTNDDPETPDAPAEEVQQDDDQFRKDLQEAAAKDKLAAEKPPEAPNAEEAPAEAKADAPLTTEPEHDLDWYKKAYPESTKEALRLKKENDELKAGKVDTPTPPVVTPPVDEGVMTPEQLYIRGKQIEESDAAFASVKEKYPALEDKDVYDKFVTESRALGAFIVQDQKRFPSPSELYEKTAVILGLTADTSEATASAVKGMAGSPRTSSAPASPAPPSKVTEAMIQADMKHYPGKTRQEIIDELEPHIN